MKLFADLVDRLDLAARDDDKVALLAAYFRRAPDPDRGAAISLLLDEVAFPRLSPAMTRKLGAGRIDGHLFELSQDFVGDLGETTALMWPARASNRECPRLGEVLEDLAEAPRADLIEVIEPWLDTMKATERRVLLKLAGRRLGVGVSAMVVRRALALLGGVPVAEIEEIWHAQEAPFLRLFDWLEGRGERPKPATGHGFLAMVLERTVAPSEVNDLDLSHYVAEWRWGGARIQVSASGTDRRIFSENGDDITKEHPEAFEGFDAEGVFDGVLLEARDGSSPRVGFLDLLIDGARDLRASPLEVRRARLETVFRGLDGRWFSLSEILPVHDAESLAGYRADCRAQGALGLVLRRRDGRYVAGSHADDWLLLRRDPLEADLVLMYLNHRAGARSSAGAEATFGAWRDGADGPELVPVAKAKLARSHDPDGALDKWISGHATKRFGPVTEVAPGLVVRLVFDAVEPARRRKADLFLRAPEVVSIAWGSPVDMATRLEVLEVCLQQTFVIPAEAGTEA